MRTRWAVFAVLVFCGLASAGDRPAVHDAECGVEVVLPGDNWKLKDMSGGGALCHVWSPSPGIVPRFSAIRESAAMAPNGMTTRARQVAAAAGGAVDVADGTVAGVAAQRIDWTARGVRAIEYGLRQGADFLIVQVAAEEAAWADDVRRAELQAIFDSLKFTAVVTGPIRVDRTTPDQVRAARAARSKPRAFAIRSHDVRVTVDPAAHSLTSQDTLTVECLGPDVSELALRLSTPMMIVDSVRVGDRTLTCDSAGPHAVRIALPAPLRRGKVVTLDFAAHADDYFLAVDQKLLAELSVLAQVRPGSTWSSHGIYYPIDAENDAAVRLRISAPEPYVTVSGGVPTDPGTGHATSETTFDARPRLLPPGFAVSAYLSKSGKTPGGLTVEVWHAQGEEERAARVLSVALRAARLFEQTMGPLPWPRVAVCHVRPERKETSVSLPGLVLLSDAFFGSGDGGGPKGAEFVAGEQSGSMAVVDELAHQWNGYTTAYPNELGEGLSSYADLLFVERESGADEYRAAVRACAAAYIGTAERTEDVAAANPAIYRSEGYRTVVFAKTPAVLHLLRQRLGEKAFFAGWRAAFESAPHDRRLEFDDFRRAFETASGTDLGSFFDAWFLRPGHPRVRVDWEAAPCDGHPGVRIRVMQTQPGPPFELDVPVLIRTAKGDCVQMFALRTREDSSLWPLPDAPTGLELDPFGDVPLVRVVER
jgi:hypothetical protein